MTFKTFHVIIVHESNLEMDMGTPLNIIGVAIITVILFLIWAYIYVHMGYGTS